LKKRVIDEYFSDHQLRVCGICSAVVIRVGNFVRLSVYLSVCPSGTTEFSGDLFVADNRPVTITTGVIISHRYSLGVPVKILL